MNGPFGPSGHEWEARGVRGRRRVPLESSSRAMKERERQQALLCSGEPPLFGFEDLGIHDAPATILTDNSSSSSRSRSSTGIVHGHGHGGVSSHHGSDPNDDSFTLEQGVDPLQEFGTDERQEQEGKLAMPHAESRVGAVGAHFCASHDKLTAKIAAFDKPTGHAQVPRIEIAPGVVARLRGAQETWSCIEKDFYLPVTCFCCGLDLCCIMDANYVLCPKCRVVSPMEGCSEGHDGGVGLGFTMEDLRQWQYEILLKRQRQQGVHARGGSHY